MKDARGTQTPIRLYRNFNGQLINEGSEKSDPGTLTKDNETDSKLPLYKATIGGVAVTTIKTPNKGHVCLYSGRSVQRQIRY